MISEQAGTYDRLSKRIATFVDELSSAHSRHFAIDLERIHATLKAAQSTIGSILDAAKATHPDLTASDPLLDTISTLFDGKVGPRPSAEALKMLFREGEQRYKDKTPPGYEDAKTKKDNRQYGDFIIWNQLIAQAKDTRKPAILVSDDSKDDWWWTHSGRTLGPRPELIEEFSREAEQSFWIYPTDRFMEFAETHLGLDNQPSAIDEVREVREQSESTEHVRGPEWAVLLGPSAKSSIDQLEAAITQLTRRYAIEEALLSDNVKAAIKRFADQEATIKALIERAALLKLMKSEESPPKSRVADESDEPGEAGDKKAISIKRQS